MVFSLILGFFFGTRGKKCFFFLVFLVLCGFVCFIIQISSSGRKKQRKEK